MLEARLGALAPQAGFEVVNLGVSRSNPRSELEMPRDVGLCCPPELVPVQFSITDRNEPTRRFDARTRLAPEAIPDVGFPDPSLRRGSQHAASRARVWCARSKLCVLFFFQAEDGIRDA